MGADAIILEQPLRGRWVKMLGFAIGSLFPQLKDPEAYATWADEVERVFNLIPSIKNLQVRGGRSGYALFDTEDVEDPGSLIYHPIPIHGTVSFTINIPSRVQNRLNPLWSTSIDNKVEEFLVFIELDSDYPYTWVAVSGDDVVKPSGAIVVVREFLCEEIAKLSEKSTLTLTTLGPSPFHADFFVEESGQAEGEVVVPGLRVSLQRGRNSYSKCTFFYDGAEFDSPAHAVEAIRQKVGPEFATFYWLTAEKVVKLLGMDALTAWVDEGVSMYRNRGMVNWLRRVLTSRSLLRNISLQLLKIQMDMTRTQRSNSKKIEELGANRGALLFDSELKGVSSLDYGSDLENLGATLKVLESQHTQTVQRLTAFAVSLLGVMVGAFLTAALRK
ncbi:hypothetical protein [Streptomyces sp900105755]|uniref:Uncharacterized protein n=1 Tax=Streptomyces sp. 900105755 TaxID=3154389 RepID=A0ABV1TX77_9ACTN